jgi:hypothetical protein
VTATTLPSKDGSCIVVKTLAGQLWGIRAEGKRHERRKTRPYCLS